MRARLVIGLALMIAAVPLQMYLMKYNQNFRDLVTEIVAKLPVQMQGLTVDLTEYVGAARNFLKSVYDYFNLLGPQDIDSSEEDPEVPEHLIKSFRPPHLEFRVGDVVLTRNMIVGAIVGWSIDKSDLSKEPEYLLLTDVKDELITETQNHMIAIENIEINSNKISQYFESYDGFRYKPKRSLQKMYPKD